MNEKIKLNLDALRVESMEMPAIAYSRVTTSQTCPTRCDTDYDCSNGCNADATGIA